VPQHLSRKINMTVETCAHRRPPSASLAQNLDRSLRAFFSHNQPVCVSGKFLSQPIGVASIKWVRPILMCPRIPSPSHRARCAAFQRRDQAVLLAVPRADVIAEGITSLLDWPICDVIVRMNQFT